VPSKRAFESWHFEYSEAEREFLDAKKSFEVKRRDISARGPAQMRVECCCFRLKCTARIISSRTSLREQRWSRPAGYPGLRAAHWRRSQTDD